MQSTPKAHDACAGISLSLVGVDDLSGIAVRFFGERTVEIEGLGTREHYSGVTVIVDRDGKVVVHGAAKKG